MCGETMYLSVRELQEHAPGGGPPGPRHPRQVREWICRECDYFEEAEGGDD